MKLVCIDNSKKFLESEKLTYNKVYEVFHKETTEQYAVLNDINEYVYFMGDISMWFKPLDEFRQEQINKILSCEPSGELK